EKHKEAAASYADFRKEIAGFHDATYKVNENTDTALRNYEKLLAQFKTQNSEGINKVLIHLKEVQDAVKEDPALNKKTTVKSLQAVVTAQNNHLAKWVESFASMACSVSLRMTKIENTQATIYSARTATISLFVPSLKPSPERKAEEKKETPSQPMEEQADMALIDKKEQIEQAVSAHELSKSKVMKLMLRLSESDELNAIIPINSNKYIKDMMTSLSNKYDRLKKILEDLGFDEYLPHPEQDPSLPRRKKKKIELDSKTYIATLYCNRAMPKRVKFVNNMVRKFLRALHPKWRAKVTSIEESKDLTSLSLDELIENLKVYEMIIKKVSEIVKAKVEGESIVVKAKKESSDEECLTSGSEDKECGDRNHLIGECPKPPKDKNQRAVVRGSWSDSGEEDDEKVKDETCLVAHASSLGFNSFEASSSGTKEIKFMKAQKNASSDGSPINMSGPQSVWAASKIIMGPQSATPESEKTVAFQISILDEEEKIKVIEKKNLENDIVDETLEIDEIVNIKESRNHPLENVIGNLNQRTLRLQAQNKSSFFCFISTIEPKNVNEASGDKS
nr:hypothetical protein [Tanacetum cinerariifolium]